MMAIAPRWALLGALAAFGGGCASAQIPYELEKVPTRTAPVHKLRVAILPLQDGRTEAPDARQFIYRGVEYTATQLRDLPGDPMLRVTEALAQHLARSRSFAQLILVLSAGQAPEADLLLSGEVFRMRGYVEARPPDERSGRPANERNILSEVVLRKLRLVDAKRPERVLMEADVGWSIHKKLHLKKEDGEPDPWRVMAAALRVAIQRFAEELETADLSGAYQVQPKVQLVAKTATTAAFGALSERPPSGWGFSRTSTATSPIGWRADKRCAHAQLQQQQTLRFHRMLGPYKPTVQLWRCPAELRLKFDAKEEFPAQYLGARQDGSRYFFHAVGQTNWLGAFEELQAHLGLLEPASKYIFELGPEGERAARPRQGP